MKLTLVRSDRERQEVWLRWFAWHPVFAESADDASGLALIWLVYVQRKEAEGYGGWRWRYREMVEKMSEYRK